MGEISKNKDGYAQQFFEGSLQAYFDVDQQFLKAKIKHILFPFLPVQKVYFEEEQGETI